MREENRLRILIIGEFSGFAKNLKSGFTDLGHKVTIVSAGDGFKKIETDSDDIKYSNKRLKLFGKYIPKSHLLFAPFENRKIQRRLNLISEHIDIIIVINYGFTTNSILKAGVNLKYIKKILSNGAKLMMICCGGDPALYNNLYNNNLKYSEQFQGFSKKLLHKDSKFEFLIRESSLIIPTSFEYKNSIDIYCKKNKFNVNIVNVIPIPIPILNCTINSVINKKIVIFHGIIRENDKGTIYFLSALEKIKDDFNDKVEVIIDGKMPYNEYIKLLDKMDILLDQTNSYGMGVNAVLGLMKGKVVLGGNEPENEENMGLGKVPIINVIPDIDYIYNILKELILNPEKVDKIKLESRKFAVENLDAKIIANRYLELI